MFNLLAQATTQISQTTSSAVNSAVTSSNSNVILNLIDQIQKTDINQLAKYCLGIIGFIWFVMVVWVFFDARRRYVHWFTAIIITLLCAIPVVGIAFLLLYAIMRPELTVQEWEVMHTNYAKLDILTQGSVSKALPMPERTEKMLDQVAEKVAVADNVQMISEAADKIEEIKTMTAEVKDVKFEVEKIVDKVEALQESLSKEKETSDANLENNSAISISDNSRTPESLEESVVVEAEVINDSNPAEISVANSVRESNVSTESVKSNENIEVEVSKSNEVKTVANNSQADTNTASTQNQVEMKKKGLFARISDFFSED